MLYNKDWLDTHMCRGDFHSIDAISRHPDVDAVKDGPNFKGWIDVPNNDKLRQDIAEECYIVYKRDFDMRNILQQKIEELYNKKLGGK